MSYQNRVPSLMVGFALLAIAGCSSPKPEANISEDQMNHFAGIAAHDHPVNTATAGQPAGGQVPKGSAKAAP